MGKSSTVSYYGGSEVRTDQLAPRSIEAEEAVLGSILIESKAYPPVSLIIEAADFFIVRHAWIFEAMTSLYERKQPIDYLTVVNEVEQMGHLPEIGGAAYILSLIRKTPSALNVEGYATIVSNMADRRRMIDGASKVARAAHSEETALDPSQAIDDAFEDIRRKKTRIEIMSMDQIVQNSDLRELAIVSLEEGETLAIPTGFSALDDVTDHQIMFERYIGVLGETRHGKSTLLQQIAMNMIESRSVDWVLYCSIEMTAVNFADRIVCARENVPFSLYLQGKLNADNWMRFRRGKDWLRAQTNFHVTGKKVSPNDVRRMADVLGSKYGAPGVIIVDTLNKMKSAVKTKDRYERITENSEQLDQIKLDGHCVMVALQHKINREGTRKPADLRPSLETVKESGAPVQDMDVLFSIYNADMYRLKFGPAWDDSHCPEKHVLCEALKLRDGSPLKPPAVLPFIAGIPKIGGTALRLISKDLGEMVDEAYAQAELDRRRTEQLQFEAAAFAARDGDSWSDDGFYLLDAK